MSPSRSVPRRRPSLSRLRSFRLCALSVMLLGAAAAGGRLAADEAPAGGSAAPASDQAPALDPTLPPDPDPEGTAPADGGATIGDVSIVVKNVFDLDRPGEDNFLFRLADRLHRTTRPEVIERQLLFRPGDPYSPERVEESARILRQNHYLYDVAIRPLRASGDQVDLEVVTRDVWTLQGGVSFHRTGGANATKIEVEDGNFLGLGKSLSLQHLSSVDRESNLVRYVDPSLRGGRGKLELWYADNSDGKFEVLQLERPFYSLDARWAAGLHAIVNDRVDPLYDGGRVTDRFRHQRDFLELYTGLSPGLEDGFSRRWRLGFTFERNLFDPAAGRPAPTALPADRTLAYPWIGWQMVEDGFTTERDFERIQRTEDLNLGRQVDLRLGFSSPRFGGDRDRLVFAGTAAAGWRPGERQILLAAAEAGTRWGQAGVENARLATRLRYFVRDLGDQLFYAGFEAAGALRPDADQQILLGGDSGLRGYPLRYAQGDRRLLLTLEQRLFSRREYFHLLYGGAAVFLDAGRAWFAGHTPERRNDWLSDVGVGLRLGSSRSAAGSMVHLDLAVPLQRQASIKSLQWLVSTSETF